MQVSRQKKTAICHCCSLGSTRAERTQPKTKRGPKSSAKGEALHPPVEMVTLTARCRPKLRFGPQSTCRDGRKSGILFCPATSEKNLWWIQVNSATFANFLADQFW